VTTVDSYCAPFEINEKCLQYVCLSFNTQMLKAVTKTKWM
jgi:hypothetical protein